MVDDKFTLYICAKCNAQVTFTRVPVLVDSQWTHRGKCGCTDKYWRAADGGGYPVVEGPFTEPGCREWFLLGGWT